MGKSFNGKVNMKKMIYIFLISSIVSSILVHIFFNNLKKINSENVFSILKSVMTYEENLINPIKASQSFLDMSKLGIIDCLILKRVRDGFVFLNHDDKVSNCIREDKFNLNLVTRKFQTSNGVNWEISYALIDPPFLNLFKYITTCLIILIISLILLVFTLREKFHKRLVENEKIKLQEKIILTQQVSHDIRSPLAALQMAIEELQDIPVEYKKMIITSVQRINDIANNLLSKYKNSNSGFNSDKLEIKSIVEIVDLLISEKRMQFRKNLEIDILTNYSKSYGLFVNIQPVEFGRLFSNLINNSVDALSNLSGKILISIAEVENDVVIKVEDNGKGIPDHVLKKLGEIGVSHGKEGTESGSGLGVYHAIKTIKNFGGRIEFSSKLNVGTVISIILPKIPSPSWFCEKIKLKFNSVIVTLDNDLAVNQTWKEQFQINQISEYSITHLSYTNVEDFLSNFTLNSNFCIYIIDFELLNQNENGLELIEKLKIFQNSYLVASRFLDEKIIKKCEELKIKIIPKAMLAFVPIEIHQETINCSKKNYDLILLDDDQLVQLLWKSAAKKHNKNFICFSNQKDLFLVLDDVDTNCTFYIDENLSENEKGVDITKRLFELGYKNLYLATGYPPDHFSNIPWIKGVVGKAPKF